MLKAFIVVGTVGLLGVVGTVGHVTGWNDYVIIGGRGFVNWVSGQVPTYVKVEQVKLLLERTKGELEQATRIRAQHELTLSKARQALSKSEAEERVSQQNLEKGRMKLVRFQEEPCEGGDSSVLTAQVKKEVARYKSLQARVAMERETLANLQAAFRKLDDTIAARHQEVDLLESRLAMVTSGLESVSLSSSGEIVVPSESNLNRSSQLLGQLEDVLAIEQSIMNQSRLEDGFGTGEDSEDSLDLVSELDQLLGKPNLRLGQK
ncbi:hypothetical protein SH449x_003308 [Pirellulaceae bacterium SH449]